MTWTGNVLALDVASKTGWAYGPPGGDPKSGSLRFAREGASMAAIFVGCRRWLLDFIKINETKLVVFEAPIAPEFLRGNTNAHTLRLLVGMTAIIEECLYGTGTDVREARVSDVRAHFLGTNRVKRNDAKRATIDQCRALGWPAKDDNAADAAALWSYQCSFLSPETAVRPTPLFMAARS